MRIMANTKAIKIGLITNGFSQKQFCDLIPISESAFSNFINNRTSISATKANKIIVLLESDFNSLFTIEGGE